MSYYQPPYPPYGSPPPPPHGYYPPQPPYPPGSHSPQPGFIAATSPTPVPQGYGGPPPQGYPYPTPSPYGQPYGGPVPGPGIGYPPPSPYPPQLQPQPQFQPQPQGPPQGPPSQPSPGYITGQKAPGDYRREADQLRKAMKGLGTDERALIQILTKPDPLQIASIRSTYAAHIGRDLHKDVRSETSGYFRQGLLGIIDGPLVHDVVLLRDAVQGVGTKEWVLNDVLLGRSNADLQAIKSAYRQRFGDRSLERDVEGDLSMKTRALFSAVLAANRHEEWYCPSPVEAEAEARVIHDATSGRLVNDVLEVCSIFARSSGTELRAINHAFRVRYQESLEKRLEREFSGHVKEALLWMLHTALDPAMRDAEALEDCMRGAGTKDERLVVRVVRLHWDRAHLMQVKGAYRVRFGGDLVQRVRGEVSGDYQRLMVALLE